MSIVFLGTEDSMVEGKFSLGVSMISVSGSSSPSGSSQSSQPSVQKILISTQLTGVTQMPSQRIYLGIAQTAFDASSPASSLTS